MTSYDTASIRGTMTKANNDRIGELLVAIEDSVATLPHNRRKALLDRLEAVLQDVSADPAAVAGGAPIAALGAGTPTTGTPTDPRQAVIDHATAAGLDQATFVRLMGSLDPTDPDTLNNALEGALGHMAPRSDLNRAESRANAAETRLDEVASELGMAADDLKPATRDWKRRLDAAKSALSGAGGGGLSDADKSAIRTVIDKVKAGRQVRSTRSVKNLSDAEISAAEGVIA